MLAILHFFPFAKQLSIVLFFQIVQQQVTVLKCETGQQIWQAVGIAGNKIHRAVKHLRHLPLNILPPHAGRAPVLTERTT